MNSKPFAALVATQLAAATAAARSYEVGIIQRTPVPKVFDERLEELALQAWKTARQHYISDETSHAFLVPVVDGATDLVSGFHARNSAQTADAVTLEVLQREIDDIAFRLYGIEPEDRRTIEMMESDRNSPQISDGADAEMDDDEGDADNSVPEDFAAEIASYTLGATLGRWDIRYATGEKPAPELPDPFAPLPVCPPGQLQNEHGLPITREDVSRLKEEGRWHYPLEIPWDGILVDDPGHPLDLEARVHQVLQIIWKDRWEAIEREACEILSVRTLRDYFRKPPASSPTT